MNRYEARPQLGELKPGQQVMVRRSANDMRGRKAEERYIPAEVVKTARVWVDLKKSGEEASLWSIYRWRMRKDTQDEGGQFSGSNASFATMEQHAWDETRNWAREFLGENGIRLDQGSRFCGREVELADIISAGTDRTEAL